MEYKEFFYVRRLILLFFVLLIISPIGISASESSQEKNKQVLSKFDPTGFTRIFDGKTLSDWDGDPTYWKVKNGTLVGTVTPKTLLKKNSWIVWRGGLVEDFELVLDYRVSAHGNSGVGYRLSVLANDPFSVRGPQADIHGEQMFTGICYEENGRRLLAARGQSTWIDDLGGQPRLIAQIADPEELQGVVRSEDWNRYRLVVKGNDAKHFINGALMSEVHDHDETNRMHRGLIGVQVHVGPPMKIEFRDIYLKRFGEQPKGKAGRGRVVYQPSSLLEREHPQSLANLVKQTARLTAPTSDRPLNNQQEMTMVTRDLGIVRHDLNNTLLYGQSKPTLSDEKQYDLVIMSGEQTVRVPGAGHLLIGKPLDREYLVRMKWNQAKKQYEVSELKAENRRDSNQKP
ncbi:MAG: DUF1080 domain-containing protein [Verrucomicrobia bacterium]|nr:DUF1080 domain-containing protein [Verrucomicrobiota bacterium]